MGIAGEEPRQVESGPIILTYENRSGGFFTYHGFLTITTLSRIISLNRLENA
jgi:hypothetical protein